MGERAKKRLKIGILSIGIFLVAYGFYYAFGKNDVGGTVSSVVAHAVEKGGVTTGIETSGTIVAAETLDLNVYKLESRIDDVRIQNGMHVLKGDLLFAFDESDVSVDIRESNIAVKEAELSLVEEKANIKDENTAIASLKDEIARLQKNISDYDIDTRDALRTFLNSNLEAVPSPSRYSVQVDTTAPIVGGVYESVQEGAYTIVLYASNADSGYSYTLSGLENGTYPVILGVETKLGTRGLTITFPATGVSSRDEWVVYVPNKEAPEYAQNLETYTKTIANLDESISSDLVSIKNKTIELEQAERGDTASKRNLSVEAAALAIERAQVNLQKGIDEKDERRIVAPFSGTIDGMENVVVGATPSKESSDTTNFGTLISDEFMVTFSLTANDVSKIAVGQKVLVSLTSLPEQKPLEAEVVEISSLPDSSAVAQYEVLALIQERGEGGIELREGMLADVEIVQEEKENVLRVPSSAIHYSDGMAYVTVLEQLSQEHLKQIETMGIVRTESVPSYSKVERQVSVGLRGQYYAEITSGVTEGDIVAVTSSTASTIDTSVVETRMGPGRREEGESSPESSKSKSS